MVVICCTSKLLKRTGFPIKSLILAPTTALGTWYANILFFHHRQVLLFVSDLSRLAVITPAKDVRSLANHLTEHLAILLKHIDAQPKWIDAEIREMANISFATTHSRSVLGTMNDYKIQIAFMLEESEDMSPLEIAMNLVECPVGPLEYRSPGVVALGLLKDHYEVS
jgi:hypothetical protein